VLLLAGGRRLTVTKLFASAHQLWPENSSPLSQTKPEEQPFSVCRVPTEAPTLTGAALPLAVGEHSPCWSGGAVSTPSVHHLPLQLIAPGQEPREKKQGGESFELVCEGTGNSRRCLVQSHKPGLWSI